MSNLKNGYTPIRAHAQWQPAVIHDLRYAGYMQELNRVIWVLGPPVVRPVTHWVFDEEGKKIHRLWYQTNLYRTPQTLEFEWIDHRAVELLNPLLFFQTGQSSRIPREYLGHSA